MELDLGSTMPKKDPNFLLESYAQLVAHQTIPNHWAQPFG